MLRLADERPQIGTERDVYTYSPDVQVAPKNVAAKVLNRTHSVTTGETLYKDDQAKAGQARVAMARQ